MKSVSYTLFKAAYLSIKTIQKLYLESKENYLHIWGYMDRKFEFW